MAESDVCDVMCQDYTDHFRCGEAVVGESGVCAKHLAFKLKCLDEDIEELTSSVNKIRELRQKRILVLEAMESLETPFSDLSTYDLHLERRALVGQHKIYTSAQKLGELSPAAKKRLERIEGQLKEVETALITRRG